MLAFIRNTITFYVCDAKLIIDRIVSYSPLTPGYRNEQKITSYFHRRNFMKTTGILVLGILVVLCFGLLWSLNSPAKSAQAPQDQRLTGNENHQVDLVTAVRFIKNHKSNLKASTIKGGFFGRNAFDKILAQPGVVGIRYYYAQTDDGLPTLVLVGVDEKGQDMQTGLLMERALGCPPWCNDSELSK
jgi:hypothetical protein